MGPGGDLEAELGRLPDGATLVLAPGRYVLTRPLWLRRPLRLLGAGPEATVVVGCGRECAVRVDGPGPVELADLGLQAAPQGPGRDGDTDRATCPAQPCDDSAPPAVDQAGLEDQAATLIQVQSARLFMRRCALQGAETGLRLSGSAQAEVHFCAFRCNGRGVVAEDQARVELESNRLLDQSGEGILFRGSSHGRAVQNDCSGNGGAGIAVEDEANPELLGNQCNQNLVGVCFDGQARGLARNNDCEGNLQHGISVAGQAGPILEGNSCCENQVCGLDFQGESRAVARSNHAHGNRAFGIQVGEAAAPILEGNHCQENLLSGLAYFGRASGLARGCECQANLQHGIQVGEAAEPLLSENRCGGNQLSGVAYYGTSGGVARGNRVEQNAQHGIQVGEQAQPVLEANRARGNQLSGIACFGESSPLLVRNPCEENLGNGIYLGESSAAVLDSNLCRGNQSGVVFSELAGGLAVRNHSRENARYGLYLGPRALPVLRENRYAGNGVSDAVSLGEAELDGASLRPSRELARRTAFRLSLEGPDGRAFELALPCELKPNERSVLEQLARFGPMSEAALARAVGTRRIGGLLENLAERLGRGGFAALVREGDGPQGNVWALRRERLGCG